MAEFAFIQPKAFLFRLYIYIFPRLPDFPEFSIPTINLFYSQKEANLDEFDFNLISPDTVEKVALPSPSHTLALTISGNASSTIALFP